MLTCQLDGNVILVANGRMVHPVSYDNKGRTYVMKSQVMAMVQVRNNRVRMVLLDSTVVDVTRPRHGSDDDLSFDEIRRIEW